MPNTIGNQINRNVRSFIRQGEIGLGAQNFVAITLQADSSRRIVLTGWNWSLVSSDLQPKFVELYLLENVILSPDSLVNPTLQSQSAAAVLYYPYNFPLQTLFNIFSDRDRDLYFRLIPGVSYSFILAFAAGNPGNGDVTLNLELLGYLQETEEEQIRLKPR